MTTTLQPSAPLPCTGKRSRSNSSSSSSSSSAVSSTGGSVFSQFTSADSLSSCSSPAVSNDASPYSNGQEDERPCKTLRTERSTSTEVALEGLGKKCSLVNEQSSSRQSSAEPEKPSTVGKSVFVDCLVDAAVNVLDVIWEAPLHRSIAFVCNDATYNATSLGDSDFAARECVCPIGRPLTGGIPLDLFIRETLRRSRTSCSTLQAALLFCKRAGGEVIRQRAQREGVTLSAEQLEKLPGWTSTYASLQTNDSTSSSSSDYILCARRTFLASVMISSKFLQDRTFSNRAWSKISGLNVRELCVVERRLLMALEFNLNVEEQDWTLWTNYLKGEWKASGSSKTRLGSDHQTLNITTIIRKSLERTSSMQKEEIYDTDLALPTGDQRAFFTGIKGQSPIVTQSSSSIATTPTLPCSPIHNETVTSTPKLPNLSLGTGESTPTIAKSSMTRLAAESRKGESSLLTTALHNHMLGIDDKSQSMTRDLSLPFPLRKGLATRSISTF